MTLYGLALDILMVVDKDVSDNPRMARKLLWLRANRFQWTKLGKMFGRDHTSILYAAEKIKNLIGKNDPQIKFHLESIKSRLT